LTALKEISIKYSNRNVQGNRCMAEALQHISQVSMLLTKRENPLQLKHKCHGEGNILYLK